jgi:hypothetical protein
MKTALSHFFKPRRIRGLALEPIEIHAHDCNFAALCPARLGRRIAVCVCVCVCVCVWVNIKFENEIFFFFFFCGLQQQQQQQQKMTKIPYADLPDDRDAQFLHAPAAHPVDRGPFPALVGYESALGELGRERPVPLGLGDLLFVVRACRDLGLCICIRTPAPAAGPCTSCGAARFCRRRHAIVRAAAAQVPGLTWVRVD